MSFQFATAFNLNILSLTYKMLIFIRVMGSEGYEYYSLFWKHVSNSHRNNTIIFMISLQSVKYNFCMKS